MTITPLEPPAQESSEDKPFFSELRNLLHGELETGTRRRAEYSSDASNYRVIPRAVVFPADEADVISVVEQARKQGLTITARGAGTSVAGNAVGTGIVVDFSRNMNRILAIDPDAKTAIVQPGVVMADLQKAAAAFGLRFGPDPSTQSRCTLGGMIGNNACGPRALQWGKTVDNVLSLKIVDGNGNVSTIGQGFDGYPELADIVHRNLATIRLEFGTFGRQVSGYSLEHLLPERAHDLAKAFTGTEGTLGLILEATVRLVDVPRATALAVLSYVDAPTAADDVLSLLPHKPAAIESMDSYLVDVVKNAQGAERVPTLPEGGAWLFVETSADTSEEALAKAEQIVASASCQAWRLVTDATEAKRLWRIREDGVGLAGRTPDGKPAWPGWEDAAVPPARLGDYLREFAHLKKKYDIEGLSYGHFGDGCVHTRLDFPLHNAPERFRSFTEEAAVLVASHGGSLSGEHGDGRARSELLKTMYSPEALQAFADLKAVFDPDGILNPGIITAPSSSLATGPISSPGFEHEPGTAGTSATATATRTATGADRFDAHLRIPFTRPVPARGMNLLHDGGDLSTAVHRCVGVGKCRADTSTTGGFMCPSFQATRDEKDSTRARARVLQEMVNGSFVRKGFSSPEVEDSLDLCLSCRACGSDCPAGVDMAAYKSEVLYRKYRGRLRPLSHYSFGWLPRWLRIAGTLPFSSTLINGISRSRPLASLGLRMAGADPRRELPTFPTESFRSWWRKKSRAASEDVKITHTEVVLWMDSFTNSLSPSIGRAAVQVLEDAGYGVIVLPRQECCGLTWITTGQLDTAKRLLRSSLDALQPHLDAGRLIIGLEPSCTAVLRSDVVELLPEDPRSRQIASATRTLAELLNDPEAPHAKNWQPPSLEGVTVLAQPHCHQHAVMGFEQDEALLKGLGAEVTSIAGCCGLAGNFGMEKGHYEVSVAVAENGLLPALREADSETVFLADGFSCRTQSVQLARREGIHIAELFARNLSQ